MQTYKQFYDSGAIRAIVYCDEGRLEARAFSESGEEVRVHTVSKIIFNANYNFVIEGPINKVTGHREFVVVDGD